MKGRPVRIQPRAQVQLSEIYDWYENRHAGLGKEFLDEVEVSLASVAENPGLYAIHRDQIRRTRTRRFPYLIFYTVNDDESVVISVFHAARDPRHWP